MSETAQASWKQGDDEYLAVSLAWLRLRLARLAMRNQAPVVVQEDGTPWQPERSIVKKLRFGLGSIEPRVLPKQVEQPSTDSLDSLIAQVESQRKAAEAMDPPPALVVLMKRFVLQRFEQDMLLLCMAVELDAGFSLLCGQAQGESTRRSPTFALGLSLFDNPSWDALSPERPLRFWRLLEITQSVAQPLTAGALRVDERIVNYAKGVNYVDDRLSPLLTTLAPAIEALPASQEQIVDDILAVLTVKPDAPIIHVMGADVASKQLVARRVCQKLNLTLMKLGAEALPVPAGEVENLARLWHRESSLLPLALYFDAQDVEKELAGVNRFLDRAAGVVFLGTRDALPGLAHEALAFEVTKPTRLEQREIWHRLLGPDRDEEAASLSAQFYFSTADIERIARQAQGTGETSAADRIWNLSLHAARPQLESLAQRIEAKADWDSLVLAEQERGTLMQIASQVRSRMKVYEDWGFGARMNRGMGVTALFAGESGTGKTMAAEVIANELKLNLHRVDLSGVVSKYIGESEKNLKRVFDAAEDGGTILFFDEADALFGKRSEVKDSHDRYANIEVNYLLQRMEAFSGLAILATNMKSALDPAFVRRLRFIVNFAFPGVAERKGIWEKALPAQTPREELDYERLARLNLTGAGIHSIALNAAFLAANNGDKVTMGLLMNAARSEFRKLDKSVNDADFRLTEAKGGGA